MFVSFVVATLTAFAPTPSCDGPVAAPFTAAAAAAARGTQATAADASPERRAPVADVVADSSLVSLYASGVDYPTFLAAARARRDHWLRNSEGAVVPADALAAARALPGRFRLLVTAVDGCSDSVNTIPFLAKLVEQVPQLAMRVVSPDAGRAVMESHRTPDGRAATPTVVVLDEAGNDVGCWVERPSLLQAKAIEMRAAGTIEQFGREKQGWYDADAGASTIREVVAVLQAAASGTPRCGPLP